MDREEETGGATHLELRRRPAGAGARPAAARHDPAAAAAAQLRPQPPRRGGQPRPQLRTARRPGRGRAAAAGRGC